MQKTFMRVKVSELVPYENNPRTIPEEAVDDVRESIRQCGDLDPIEVDENMVILSGHTRRLAYLAEGVEETDIIMYSGLTENQKKKYRLLANKTGEKTGWDFAKLDVELPGIDFEEYDFGFDVDEMDVSALDGLFGETEPKEPKEPEPIQCPHCGQWFTP